MSASEPREIPFNGVRLRFDSSKNFDELVDALLADVGEKPLMIDDIAKVRELGFIRGRGGIPRRSKWFHVVRPAESWRVDREGRHRKKVLRLIIGNPLIAITMLRHDVTAGLFAPVELFLSKRTTIKAV